MLIIIAMEMIFYLFVGSTPEKQETIDVNIAGVKRGAFGYSPIFDVNVKNSVLYVKEIN